MGLITNTLWLNAKNGSLTFKLEGHAHESSAQGFRGIIQGVRTRQQTYDHQTRTMIELAMRDATDGTIPNCIISGTLLDNNGNVTTFGKMLLSRLAHPDCMNRKGNTIELAVWGASDNDRVTCCTLRDPATRQPLGYYDTLTIPPESMRNMVEQWAKAAMDHYGTFGRSDYPSTSLSHTENDRVQSPLSSEENTLPF